MHERGRLGGPVASTLKPDKPVCRLEATAVNQMGTTLLEDECWTYTLQRG
jgi:hypothetical protein